MMTLAMNPVGKTGLKVSAVSFGGSALGDMPDTYGYAVSEERARATIRAIFAGPATMIDTSRIYGLGRSEERIGAAIAEMGGLPKGFAVSTKLDRDFETGKFDAARARRSLEDSLKALGLPSVQILHLHDPEYASDFADVTRQGGALTELFKLKAEGLCDAVGFAAGKVEVMTPLIKDWDFDAIITHNRYTLLNRNASAMIDVAVSRGTAVFNAAPYAGGVFAKGSGAYQKLAYQDADAETLAPVRQVEAICARFAVPPGAAALQFSLRDKRIASTICGVSKPERVKETIDWANWPIPEEMWAELAKVAWTNDDPEAKRKYRIA